MLGGLYRSAEWVAMGVRWADMGPGRGWDQWWGRRSQTATHNLWRVGHGPPCKDLQHMWLHHTFHYLQMSVSSNRLPRDVVEIPISGLKVSIQTASSFSAMANRKTKEEGKQGASCPSPLLTWHFRTRVTSLLGRKLPSPS